MERAPFTPQLSCDTQRLVPSAWRQHYSPERLAGPMSIVGRELQTGFVKCPVHRSANRPHCSLQFITRMRTTERTQFILDLEICVCQGSNQVVRMSSWRTCCFMAAFVVSSRSRSSTTDQAAARSRRNSRCTSTGRLRNTSSRSGACTGVWRATVRTPGLYRSPVLQLESIRLRTSSMRYPAAGC